LNVVCIYFEDIPYLTLLKFLAVSLHEEQLLVGVTHKDGLSLSVASDVNENCQFRVINHFLEGKVHHRHVQNWNAPSED